MNSITAPFIRYGRFTSENMGGNDQYSVLDSSPDFPAEARSLLERRIVQSFQWTNGSIDVYPDSFLFWRLDSERFLFARLSDGGKDSRNRPHSVRILAALLKDAQFENLPEGLATLANTSAWSEPADGFPMLQPTGTIPAKLAESLKSALASGKQSILILRHPFVQKSEEVFGIKDYSETDFPVSNSSYISTYRSTNTNPFPLHPIPKENDMNKYVVYLLLFLLALSLGNNLLLSKKFSDFSHQISEIDKKFDDTEFRIKKQIESLKTQISDLEGKSDEYVTQTEFNNAVKSIKDSQVTKEDLEQMSEELKRLFTEIMSENNKQAETVTKTIEIKEEASVSKRKSGSNNSEDRPANRPYRNNWNGDSY